MLPAAPVLVIEDLFPFIRRGTLPHLSARDMADVGGAIERRRLDQVRDCLFCTGRACFAFAFGPSDLIGPARWVDACAAHGSALQRMAAGLAWDLVTDDEIVRRYEAWERGHGPSCE